MPKIIFMKNYYAKHTPFELKSVLERKLYGKIVDICRYTEKKITLEDDPYGEEDWNDESSISNLEKLIPICRDVRIIGALLKAPQMIVAVRVDKDGQKRLIDLRSDNCVILDKDVKESMKHVKPRYEFLNEWFEETLEDEESQPKYFVVYRHRNDTNVEYAKNFLREQKPKLFNNLKNARKYLMDAFFDDCGTGIYKIENGEVSRVKY